MTAACVYKPVAGERPLWDFPDGTLAEREVAAYAVSAASGWDIVPPTVYRVGPAGPGMVQLWIDTDDDADLVALIRGRGSDAIRRIAVFDAVINNADRKGGHLLPTAGGHVYGVDHGVSFHTEDKLRTVLWQWAGRTLPTRRRTCCARLRRDLDGALGETLGDLLTTAEVRRTRARVDRLLVDPPAPGAAATTGPPCPGRRCSSLLGRELGEVVQGRADAGRLRCGKPNSLRKNRFLAGRASHCSVTSVPPSTGSNV